MKRRSIVLAALAVVAGSVVAVAERSQVAAPASRETAVDAVFSRWTASTPGCAVGVATAGRPVLAKGYGMADLEHDVRITPDTIFEAGSVSKQFTAAAVLLLAREAKLSLDDPVRKYIPELPPYSPDVTVRHMLNHTSGLRDWGSVAGIAGWPRTTRVHTHAHVLDIVSRQQSLNFPPGTRWSYSNTGFNLAAIIVSRVSGVAFADFTRERLFKPVGMDHTSWRDDYTRIVKNRAIAYDERDGVWHEDMPFENVYGNGGLLTTVGDLLKWNENFTTPVVGDRAFVEEEQRPGHFTDGRIHGYALGLFVGAHRGFREVYHSGSTAGYSAFLTRFPDQRLSVAVLCNAATNATTLAHDVADAYDPRQGGIISGFVGGRRMSAEERERLTGLYRNLQTGVPRIVQATANGLKMQNGQTLSEVNTNLFETPGHDRWQFDGKGGATLTDEFGTTDRFERVPPSTPSAQALQAYTGVYASDEAETEFKAVVEVDHLVLRQRPDRTIALSPVYADAFHAGPLGLVLFHRDGAGRVVDLSVVQDRVWNMVFHKMTAAAPTAAGRPR